MRDERRNELGFALLDLDREDPRPLREAPEWCRPKEPAGIDRDEEVAHPLDLAEEVARDDDGDPEFGAGPAHEREHLVAARRVEPVRRLVEQEQARTVHQRLGELDPLLHPGRVASHRPVALLVQPDVAEDLGGALAGGGARQAAHPRHVRHEVGRGRIRGQTIVLGHVAHELADGRSARADVKIQHPSVARSRARGARAGS